MPSILHRLPRTALDGLSRAFSSGRVQPPYTGLALREWLPGTDHSLVSRELERFRQAAMTPVQIGMVLELLAHERARQQEDADRIQMVWTGPDQDGPDTRDTGVVARELMRQASKSLLITTYSLSAGSAVFAPVQEAMARNPNIEVTIALNVDMSLRKLYEQDAVIAFSRRFWSMQWPWENRPKVFYDPRSIRENLSERAIQHAKCIVADVQRVFITSANYTASGQERNIELGAVIHDERLAERVSEQFRSLIAKRLLVALPTPV